MGSYIPSDMVVWQENLIKDKLNNDGSSFKYDNTKHGVENWKGI